MNDDKDIRENLIDNEGGPDSRGRFLPEEEEKVAEEETPRTLFRRSNMAPVFQTLDEERKAAVDEQVQQNQQNQELMAALYKIVKDAVSSNTLIR